MRQQFDINNIPEPNSISLTQGVMILEENGVSCKPRVYESSSKADKIQIIQDNIPLRMVVHVDFPKKRVKHSGIRKVRTSKKVSSSNHGQSEHDLDSVMKDIESDQHVDPNVGPSRTTSGKSLVALIKTSPITVNVPVLDKSRDDILDEKDVTYDSSSEEEPQIKRRKVQRKKNVVADQANEKTINKYVITSENDDIPLVSIIKGIIKNKEIE